jgi:hypothetical protein
VKRSEVVELDLAQERQQAHAYLDQLPAAQLTAVRHLLESMVDPVSAALANAPIDDEELTEEDANAIRSSREWFEQNDGTPFESVVAELGLGMDNIRNYKEPA